MRLESEGLTELTQGGGQVPRFCLHGDEILFIRNTASAVQHFRADDELFVVAVSSKLAV
jgi:hypothetical protein